MNVKRRDEPVAIDNVYSDTPAINNWFKQAQVCVGIKTIFIDVYSKETDSQFFNTLKDCIRDRGVMSQLSSDSAQVEISKHVLDILIDLCIGDW